MSRIAIGPSALRILGRFEDSGLVGAIQGDRDRLAATTIALNGSGR